MREIKFRIWDSENEIWLYETVQSVVNACWYEDTSSLELPEGEPKIINQYTGLKDKNGKEIYEGDILKDNELSGIVFYRPPAFVVAIENQINLDTVYLLGGNIIYPPNQNQLKDTEVIGNIYENPELLKQQEQKAGKTK